MPVAFANAIPKTGACRRSSQVRAVGQPTPVQVDSRRNGDRVGELLDPSDRVLATPRSPFVTGRMAYTTSSGRSVVPGSHLPLPVDKQIVFVRHGLSTWNQEGRIQGASDLSHLTAFGLRQAALTRDALANIPFEICISSPIARAQECAEIIWKDRESPVVYTDNLKEADLGWLQGQTNAECAEKHPDVYDVWRYRPEEFVIDGRQPVVEVFERSKLAWQELVLRPESTLLVVTHKSILRALVCTALGLPPASFRAVDVHNAGVVIFLVNKLGEPMLQHLNLSSHLHHPEVRY